MEFPQIALYIVSLTSFYIALSVGFGFTMRSVKFFNFAYGGAFLIGGYTMFLFYRELLFPFIISLFFSLLASGLYLLLAYYLVFLPLLRRKAKGLVSLIASFGILAATSAVLGIIFGNQTTLIARHLSDIQTTNIFGLVLNSVQLSGIIVATFLVVIIAFIRQKTHFGYIVRAVENDAEVAELVGISTEKTYAILFFASGIFAGLAGIADGFDIGIIPATGLIVMLPTIIAAVIGGMGSFWGGVLGAFILAVVQKTTVVIFGGVWEQAVPFLILIIILWLRPEGILKE